MSAGDRQLRGLRGLEALGPLANARLPELIALATNNIGYCAVALLAVGPAALPTYTNLIAQSMLPQSKLPPTQTFIASLANAVHAERIQPEEAAMAIPVLLEALRSNDPLTRNSAAAALGALRVTPALRVPLLLRGLSDPDTDVRLWAAQSLGSIGEWATNALPALEKACSDPEWPVRNNATNAILRIRAAMLAPKA